MPGATASRATMTTHASARRCMASSARSTPSCGSRAAGRVPPGPVRQPSIEPKSPDLRAAR
eukprot:1234533-Prymnesium_polylepis.2